MKNESCPICKMRGKEGVLERVLVARSYQGTLLLVYYCCNTCGNYYEDTRTICKLGYYRRQLKEWEEERLAELQKKEGEHSAVRNQK